MTGHIILLASVAILLPLAAVAARYADARTTRLDAQKGTPR